MIRAVEKNKAEQLRMCAVSTCWTPPIPTPAEGPMARAVKALLLGLEMYTLCTVSPTP